MSASNGLLLLYALGMYGTLRELHALALCARMEDPGHHTHTYPESIWSATIVVLALLWPLWQAMDVIVETWRLLR